MDIYVIKMLGLIMCNFVLRIVFTFFHYSKLHQP